MVQGASVDWPVNYNRYLVSASGNYNRECVYFDVPGSCNITVVAQSDENRKLIVIDQYGYVVDEIDTTSNINEYTIQYNGDPNKIYVWSIDSNIKIYAVMLSSITNATSLLENLNISEINNNGEDLLSEEDMYADEDSMYTEEISDDLVIDEAVSNSAVYIG